MQSIQWSTSNKILKQKVILVKENNLLPELRLLFTKEFSRLVCFWFD